MPEATPPSIPATTPETKATMPGAGPMSPERAGGYFAATYFAAIYPPAHSGGCFPPAYFPAR